MNDLDTERTKLKFSLPQLCTIIGALVVCTWRVNSTLNELRNDIRAANDRAGACWTVEDQNRWVWAVNRAGKISLPYPIELKSVP
jgi:hypothetical protein